MDVRREITIYHFPIQPTDTQYYSLSENTNDDTSDVASTGRRNLGVPHRQSVTNDQHLIIHPSGKLVMTRGKHKQIKNRERTGTSQASIKGPQCVVQVYCKHWHILYTHDSKDDRRFGDIAP